MVTTILPMVHGDENTTKVPAVSFHFAGSLIGAILVGFVLTLLGTILPRTSGVMLLMPALVCVVYGLHEVQLISAPLPQIHRQVPSWWRRTLDRRLASFLYGVELGAGVMTFIRMTGFYALIAWAVLRPFPVGLMVMGCFGLGRALPLAWARMRWGTEGEFLNHSVAKISRYQRVVHLGNALLLTYVGCHVGATALIAI